MKNVIAFFRKNKRSTAILFDLISPILLYVLLNGGKQLLSTILFITVILIRIIYVAI